MNTGQQVSSVIVWVVVAGVFSVIVGIATSFVTLLTRRGGRQLNPIPEDDNPTQPIKVVTKTKVIVEQDDSTISSTSIYWSFAMYTMALGAFLMASPDWFFGPSWRYFEFIPHNGIWMGVTCFMLGAAQIGVLWRYGKEKYRRPLSILFFASGFSYWTAGMILGTEGLVGHQGLMEAPFMMFAGGYQFVHGADLNIQAKLYGDKTFRPFRTFVNRVWHK